MASFPGYDNYDALGLAELVRKREVTAEELMETAIERIEARNPSLNAVIHKTFDLARESIRKGLPEGPFTGVPFLAKDLITSLAGVPLTMGSKLFRDYVPSQDSELMKRYKESGVVILGKTNTPEFGLMGITEPELHGPTRNPWNTGHTPGGSSGGSASAVAGGMVPMASGGDGGGSIRIPSAYCGLFGLKPSRGRTTLGPAYGESWQGAVVEHVLTRTVRDSAAMLDAVCGPMPGDPYGIPRPENRFLLEMEKDPGRLNIGFSTKSPLGTEVHPECRQAVEHAARLLESLGHNVEEADPPVDGTAIAKSYFMMYFGEVAADIQEFSDMLKRKLTPDDVEGTTWSLALLGRAYSAGEFVLAMREWNRASRAMAGYFERYHLFLTPTAAFPPARIGELKVSGVEEILMKVTNKLGLSRLMRLSGIADKVAVESLSRTPFTQLANITGLPAASLPLHWTRDNLPCGVHLTAPYAEEGLIFRISAQLEKTQPWFDRRP